jgi:DNA-binding CsgD family transcriptional regulator
MPKRGKEVQELPSLALVFGYIAIKDLQRLEDRVRVLARLGYGNREIAQICGTTANSVAVQKSWLKGKSGRER